MKEGFAAVHTVDSKLKGGAAAAIVVIAVVAMLVVVSSPGK